MKALRIIVGITFIFTGTFKLLLPVLIPMFQPGAPGFSELLRTIGVPFPEIAAWLVIGSEILGGLALVLDRWKNLACAALAFDMGVAIATVGVPGLRGTPIVVQGITIGAEPWRVPLEAALLVACVVVGKLWNPSPLRYLRSREPEAK